MRAGYPFDIPEAGASLLTYCALVYHLPLVMAFSVRERISFVWGGCMLLPLRALLENTHGIMRAWSQVGLQPGPWLSLAAVCVGGSEDQDVTSGFTYGLPLAAQGCADGLECADMLLWASAGRLL